MIQNENTTTKMFKECRKLRRKCVRSSPYEICNRCIRFERECTAPGDLSTESDSDDDDMARLTKEFEGLDAIVNQLEEQMRTLRRGEQRQQIAYHTMTHEPSTDNNSSQWRLTIHNGRLRIETGIRNISDLLRSDPIRYLSPRLSRDQSNQDLVVHFSTGKTMRLRLLAVKLLVKCLNPKPDPTALLLPTFFLFNATSIIDTLVNIYFECHNIFRPMIHKPSFMSHYRQVSSPLESLLCLCICCVVCVCPCNHLTHSYQELRHLGDYFAGLAKSRILDQFDLPEKRLETLMASNILGEYLYTVLKVSEGLKLVTMGYQICLDLKPWFNEECKKPGKTSVDCMLFSRHYSTTIYYNRLSDLIVHNTEELRNVHYPEWKYVLDEPKQTIEFVKAQNWYYRLCNHPIMAKIR
ncbi:hypothetical protein K501DRAFT_280686, partial [Backusella circina FSU 941]